MIYTKGKERVSDLYKVYADCWIIVKEKEKEEEESCCLFVVPY